MPKLIDIHGESYSPPHSFCPDLHCCKCECQTCKRAWWAAGRPRPQDCPTHGAGASKRVQSAPKSIWERLRDDDVLPDE